MSYQLGPAMSSAKEAGDRGCNDQILGATTFEKLLPELHKQHEPVDSDVECFVLRDGWTCEVEFAEILLSAVCMFGCEDHVQEALNNATAVQNCISHRAVQA